MRERARVEPCNTDLSGAKPGATSLPKAQSDRERPRVTDCDALLSHSGTGEPVSPATPTAPRRNVRYVTYPVFVPPTIEPIPPPTEPPVEPPVDPPVEPPIEPPEPPLYEFGFYDTFEDYNDTQSIALNEGYNWEPSSEWEHFRTKNETLLYRELFANATVGGGFGSIISSEDVSEKNVYIVAGAEGDTHNFRLGGNATCRKFLPAYVGAWDELWLMIYWAVDQVIDPTVAPYPVPSTELFWSFGLQRGVGTVFNGDGPVPHSIGVKAAPFASVNSTTAQTAGGINYTRCYTEATKVENGVATSSGIKGAFRVAASEQGLHNAIIVRFLNGSPTWTVSWLRPDTDATVEADVTNADVVSIFNAADWTAAKALLPGYSENTYTVAVDTGTFGDFDAVYLSWPHWLMKARIGGIFGRVFLT